MAGGVFGVGVAWAILSDTRSVGVACARVGGEISSLNEYLDRRLHVPSKSEPSLEKLVELHGGLCGEGDYPDGFAGTLKDGLWCPGVSSFVTC